MPPGGLQDKHAEDKTLDPDRGAATAKGRERPKPPTAPARRPHDRGGLPPLSPWRPPESQPCRPPSWAAAPASKARNLTIRSLHNVLGTVGAKGHHPLLALHQALDLGQHLHGRKPPHLRAQLVPVGHGDMIQCLLAATTEASLDHIPMTLAQASTHDATLVAIIANPPDGVATSRPPPPRTVLTRRQASPVDTTRTAPTIPTQSKNP